MSRPQILIVELGSQYTQVIGRTLREAGYRSVILDPKRAAKWLIRNAYINCIILSGGPKSVYEEDAPKIPEIIMKLAWQNDIVTLGICYGMQRLAYDFGGKVESIEGDREYGPASVRLDQSHKLFEGLSEIEQVWASHGDTVTMLPERFKAIAWQEGSGAIAAMASEDNLIFGVQFHPEVVHTPCGKRFLMAFAKNTGCTPDWQPVSMASTVRSDVASLAPAGTRAVMGMSGGVDSTTLGAVLSPVFGENLLAITIDGGHLREGELDEIRQHAEAASLRLKVVDAKREFLEALAGLTDAEEKRAAFKRVYTAIFNREAKAFGATFFLQGTLAPDVIESGEEGRDLIKSHHNVGVKIDGCESLHPFASLFKYEVREIARELGLPKSVWQRQPFPGPGLFLRIVGMVVTEEALDLLRKADAAVTTILKENGEYDGISQLVVALWGTKTTGLKGDARAYGLCVVVRAVITIDFMTAEGYDFPTKVKKLISRELTKLSSKNHSIVRVLWDVTDKPTGTTEFQ